MKICILSMMNIKHMTMVSVYTSFLEKQSIDYDVIYADKYGEEEHIGAKNIYRYNIKIDRNWNKAKKLTRYISFRNYAIKLIQNNNYDYIIVWRTETALLFYDFLVTKYKNRYALNIRDYCNEKNPIFFRLIKRLVRNSNINTVSSEGFLKFLPKDDYTFVHSYNKEILDKLNPRKNLRKLEEPVRICFIGYVRFFDKDKALINALGNDYRFIIQYFGEGSQILEKYAKENGINNVEFIGGFKKEETYNLLKKADVINNLYGNKDISLNSAISIKYYYSIYMNIPVLIYNDTYMEEITNKVGNGFVISDDLGELPDEFYNWYHSIKYDEFKKNCEDEKDRILKKNEEFEKKLKKIFLNDGV